MDQVAAALEVASSPLAPLTRTINKVLVAYLRSGEEKIPLTAESLSVNLQEGEQLLLSCTRVYARSILTVSSFSSYFYSLYLYFQRILFTILSLLVSSFQL